METKTSASSATSPAASAVFQMVAGLATATLMRQIPRRERWILLLVDGRRTLADLARLTQRSELDVAATLAVMLHRGYIEPVVWPLTLETV